MIGFWSQVAVKDNTRECWEWIGARDVAGYGRWRRRMAHHVAYEFAYRPMWLLADSKRRRPHLLHSCDNPPCVNPRHLRVGDANGNGEDRRAQRKLLVLSAELRGDFHAKASSYETPPMLAAGALALRADFWRGIDIATLTRVYNISRTAAHQIVRRFRFDGLPPVPGEPIGDVDREVGRRIAADYSESRRRGRSRALRLEAV